MNPRSFASRVVFVGFASLLGMFFALPMLWLVFAPFNSEATLAAKPCCSCAPKMATPAG